MCDLDDLDAADDFCTSVLQRYMPPGTRATAFAGPPVSAARLYIEWGIAPAPAPEPRPYRVSEHGIGPRWKEWEVTP